MINIEQALTLKYPSFARRSKLLRLPTISLLKKLIYQDRINDFLHDNEGVKGFSFVDAVLNYFSFDYTISAEHKARIPSTGRVVIVANHPIGSLDGLSIVRMVGEVRPDVKIVANDMLSHFEGLNELIIPLDNMGSGSRIAGARKSYRAVLDALENEEAIIVFPAGEVSRVRPYGVRDTYWQAGFLNFARRSKSPILPVHIQAKNSWLFYAASMVFKPLGTALLAHEMFNKRSAIIRFSVGDLIPVKQLSSTAVLDRALVKRLKKHLYAVGASKKPLFETEQAVAESEPRQALIDELANAKVLGETRDGNSIYLVDCAEETTVLREIGRLREIAFRKVGEGTGARRDIDKYDLYYRHLVLWDRESSVIAGAYRLGECQKILRERGLEALYTQSLYSYSKEFLSYIEQGVELGRSFVNPDYWGRASLDYLWQGLAAYISQNPCKYLLGPVSMSADYPRELMDTLVYFYLRYFSLSSDLTTAFNPYVLSPESKEFLDTYFGDADCEEAESLLTERFKAFDCKLPVLFKQYLALYDRGGFRALAFSIDTEFGDCLDGMCMAEVPQIKAEKRKRYFKNLDWPFDENGQFK